MSWRFLVLVRTKVEQVYEQSLSIYLPLDLQDLRKGAKIQSADGDIIEVIKVEAQRTTKLLELKRPG